MSALPRVRTVLRDSLSDLVRAPFVHVVWSLPLFVATWVSARLRDQMQVWMSTQALSELVLWLEDELLALVVPALAGVGWAGVFLLVLLLPSIVWGHRLVVLQSRRLGGDAVGWVEPALLGGPGFVSYLGLALVLLPLRMVGLVAFVLPAIVVDAVFSFAFAAMVIHQMPLRAAVRRSVRHFLHHPRWRLSLSALLVLGQLGSDLLGYPNIVVPALWAGLTVRAYGAWFGDATGSR